ncbi:MAG: zf-HC2 domain-containing protein [Deltaproteobacteria bacterium]|nr:zf-HC2 domain-containing protein [Deltaproteobacteria bacterium]
MNCTTARKQLPLLLEGDLDVRKARPIDRHLEGCVACAAEHRELVEDQRWLREGVNQLAAEAPLDDYAVHRMHARVMENLKAPSRWRPRAWDLGWLGVVGLASVAFWVVLKEPRLKAVLSKPVPNADPVVRLPIKASDARGESSVAQLPDWRRHWRQDEPILKERAESESLMAQADPPRARKAIELRVRDPGLRIIWLVEPPIDGQDDNKTTGPATRPSL